MARAQFFAGLGAFTIVAAVACSVDRAPVAPTVDSPAVTAAAAVTAATPADAGRAQRAAPQPIGEAQAILRTRPLDRDITVSAVIGPRGGQLEIPEAGLRVEVPRGAVSEPTTFTATALKGDMVAYEFAPEGARFAVPLLVRQGTERTNIAALPALTILQAGYFTGPEMLDATTKRARVAEVTPTFGVALRSDVAFLVRHFSGYIIQYGFRPTGP